MPRIESSEGDRRIPRPEDILNKTAPPTPPTDDEESLHSTRSRLRANFRISRGRADECQAGTNEWFACQSDLGVASEQYLTCLRYQFFSTGGSAPSATTDLNASPPPRTPRDTPKSGQYLPHARPEGDVVLRSGTVLEWWLARYASWAKPNMACSGQRCPPSAVRIASWSLTWLTENPPFSNPWMVTPLPHSQPSRRTPSAKALPRPQHC